MLLSTTDFGSKNMKTKQVLGTLLVIVTLFFTSFPLISIGVAPMGPPPPNGDWVVADNTAINDTTIELNGNLSISNSGNLNLTNVTLIMNGNITVEGAFILRNVTLIMNCSANKEYGIVVESSGVMHVLDYDNIPGTNDHSMINSGIPDGHHRYTFWVKSGSNFRMENSILSECGYDPVYATAPHLSRKAALFIDANNTQIKNCTIN